MKSFLLVLSFVSITVFSNSQIILLSENFNAGFPSGWQVIDNDGLTPDAQVTNITSGFAVLEDDDTTGVGDSIVACTSYFDPIGTADNYLILPAVTLKQHGNILHWDAMSQDPSFPDGYEVLISNTVPVIDSFHVDTLLFYTDAEQPYWTQRTVSLDDYVNETVYIAFHHFSSNKFILKFDNIVVDADTTLSVEEIYNNLVFTVYPNPSSDIINVSVGNNDAPSLINIYNTLGEIVISNSKSKSINIGSVANGMYMMEVVSGNSRGVRRIIIQH